MIRPLRALALAAVLLPAAYAQFQFSVVVGTTEQPVGAVYDFGKVASGDSSSVHLRLRNTSHASATLTLLAVAGTGFTLSGGPSLPAMLDPQATADFTVTFTASITGSYSAALSADGVSAELAAEVVPGLTYQVETLVGTILLGPSVDFGSALVGQAETMRFDVSDQTGLALPVPGISLSGGDFALSAAVPAGLLQPGQSSSFDVQFLPTAAGLRNATLTIGARTVALSGTGIMPDLPEPQITLDLAQAQSAQQGSVQVTFDHPAATSGDGMLTLAVQPAVTGPADPSIAFAAGGLTAAFTFNVGDTQASFGGQTAAAFQTGTTAGNLVFTAQITGAPAAQAVQRTVSIAPALVGLTTAAASRSAGAITVQLDGFDNTRTAGALTFSFFDASGNTLTGPIAVDGGPAFQAYFQDSETGGSFGLQAVFPVTGDPARIAFFTANVANQAGTTTTARTPF
ncbi:MAG TPA: choice-of-anchor D domain-containing protein [Bryobacteraceae bacterium]|nr:choice-of-anchor D domain-containing protein [Bryobacteraceae bacterium]